MSESEEPRRSIQEHMRRATEWLQRCVTHPREELTRWQSAARFAYDLGIHGARQLRQDRAAQMAAALSFRTLFGLLPLLVVGTLLIKAFGGFDTFVDSLTVFFERMGLDGVRVQNTDDGIASQSLAAWLEGFVIQVRDLDLRAITWVGLGVLAYSAISLLITIESSFNAICRAPSGRPWLWRLLVYWAVVTVGPAVLIGTFYVDAQFTALVADGPNGQVTGFWHRLLGMSWSFAATSLAMFAAYKLLPNANVRARPALVGAIVAALLLEIGKRLLGFYVSDALSFRHLYGSLGLIPLFMFWVYVMWLVILFGLEVTATLQTLAGRPLKEVSQRPEPSGIVDPSAIVTVMGLAAERFSRSQETTARDVVVTAGIAQPIAERMLEQLCTTGFLRRLDASADPGAARSYVLARPATTIDAGEVLRVGQQLIDGGAESVAGDLRSRLQRAQLELVSGETIDQIRIEPAPSGG